MVRTVLLVLLTWAVALPADEARAAPSGPELSFDGLGALVPTLADDDIGLVARFHFATHTTDFDRARDFYRELGWTEGRGGFPLTNTHQMARALGMFDLCQYELAKGEVISHPGSVNTANIDLLQFVEPFNDDPPYALPNHLGMAYAGLLTTNLDADIARLTSAGATLLAEPYGIPGNRFVFFRDPDGVLYKLKERVPPHGDAGEASHIMAMPYIAINVSDFAESLAFYRQLGYTLVRPLPGQGDADEGRAFGLDGPFRVRGADIALGRGDQHVLRLVQWLEPFDPEPPYPPPINHIGINRIALLVPDLERAVAILEAQGAEFLSDPANCCTGTAEDAMGIVHVLDPDGSFLELVGPMAPRAPAPQPEGCPPLEIRYPEPD